MLKLCGFCVFIAQLCLASDMNADLSIQITALIPDVKTSQDVIMDICVPLSNYRVYHQKISLRADPLPSDPRKLLTDSFKNTKASSATADSPTAEPLTLPVTSYQGITHSCDVTFKGQCCFNQTETVFETFKSEMMSNQKHIEKLEEEYNHQTIIIMEEDPIVAESATYLFERHFTISTLLIYKNGKLCVVRGSPFSSTRNHDVILVGHGSKSTNGTVKLSGFGPGEIAKFVSVLKTELFLSQLGTISLISCRLGNDLHFILQLLQAFQSYNIKTMLHLYDSFVSVTSEGKLLTRSNGVWRFQDHSRRIFAELDQGGRLLTKAELGCTGPVFPEYKGSILYLQTLEWPNHPQMFVPAELRKRYPSIDCLEGLTWSLFFEENERRRAPNYVPDNNQRTLKAIWLTEPRPEEESTNFKHIMTIQDLLVEIRYNAREEIASNLYYVLNECIYKVNGRNLNVSLVGKFMITDNQGEIESFHQNFGKQQGWSSLHDLRQGLKAAKFNDFCRQTFQFQQCSYNCERWGHYFMVAVFAASVRNFRTFSLFLMSVIGCEVGRIRGIDSSLCTAFVDDDHPMATEQAWPEQFHRGFYGCTVDNYELAPQDKQMWLDVLVAKENALYVKSKQLMNGIYHDEQTELDIFGRVKVMNKYVFSSYLEFFRGTPEGRRLKRGCTASFNDKLKP
ncbi:uncharacterized protein LOC121202609 [Betta splendens]|uniref:Uncharacterized protein LOC121202609 n=1 Tax=Betta splendens TaxID=158456 RepID=A0A8M1HK93_BETSP|nr:uncharacterized protein LOC121202609 [Betta splendens]